MTDTRQELPDVTQAARCLDGTAALPEHHAGLHDVIDRLRAQSEADAVTMVGLQTLVAEYQADNTYLAGRILAEARERDWCEVYDEWAGEVNEHCTHFRLPERVSETSRAYMVVVRFQTEPSRFDEATGVIAEVIQDHLGDHAQLEWLEDFEVVRTAIQPT